MTDRQAGKQASDIGRESETAYRTLAENVPDIVYRVHLREDRMQFFNDRITDITGYGKEELEQGRICSMESCIVDEDRERVIGTVNHAVRSRSSFEVEYRFRHKNGTILTLLERGTVVPGGDGTPIYIDGVIRDMTDRKRAEDALREKETKYRVLFESANDGIFIQNEKVFLDCNRRGAEMYGLPTEAIIGRAPGEFAPERQPDGRLSAEVAGEKIQAALNGSPQVFEWQPLRADGTPFDVEITLSRLTIERALCLQAIVRDITERKREQRKLAESQRFLQAIIDAEPECVKVLDENSCLIMMNRAGLDMLQADSLEQVKGQCVCPLITSEHRPSFMDLTRRVFRGESGILAFEMVGRKGRHLWLETHAVPLRNEKDEIIALLGVTRDITAKKQAEEALQKSEARFRSIIEQASSGIMVAEVETRRILYANPEICRLLGYSEQEFLALTSTDLIVQGEQQGSVAGFQAHAEGRLRATERTFRRKDGSSVLMSISSVRMDFDNRPCLVGFFSDITERHLLEEERLKTQKLESIGTLAGGIAHDFNNLLQGLFGYLTVAKRSIDQRERALAMLEQAEKALHLSVNLTTQLLTFSKGGIPVKKRIPVRPMIENAAKFALSGSRVDHRLLIEDAVAAIDADEGQIGQVIQNIVLNADQAMPAGGTIVIAVRNVHAHDQGVPPGLEQGDFVAISIRDSGSGIPEHSLSRIFDPYFTTKEKGSGLGLATSYSIVKNHGGLIDVQSKIGKGSVFTIYLPVAAAAASEEPARPAAASAGRRGRILLMDDEELVRMVAGELLGSLGHEADFTEHGAAAVEKYRQGLASGRPYDIVILDLTVRGGMGGLETLRKLRELDPQVKAVVSSGYSDDAAVSEYQSYGFRSALQKPYDIDELNAVLNELLT